VTDRFTEESVDRMFPEHVKAREVKDEMGVISEFVEWLEMRGLHIVDLSCTPFCRTAIQRPQTLIAEHFGIDEKKFSDEKDAMLTILQEQARSK
jgi:hypothetical protein